MSVLKKATAMFAANIPTLLGLGASTWLLRSHMVELYEEHEARMGM